MVWLHIVATTIWVGGMLFIALVLVPLTRGMEPPGTGPRVLSQIARRFRYIAWPALIVLILTGIGNAAYYGVTWSRVTSGDLFDTTFGQLLSIKVWLVAAALLFSVVHDFFIGPRLSALTRAREAGSGRAPKEAVHLRKVVSWLARLNLLLALVIVALAVMMIRGLP